MSVAARVDAALAALTPREQVAQLFVVGVPLTDLAAGDVLVGAGVGGIFLRGRSTLSTTALDATTSRWAALAAGPRPWVAADQEGGQVQTLSGPGFGVLPRAVDQGRLPLPALDGVADQLGASLAAAGVSLDLAPVADVVPAGTERTNTPIGAHGRQYGADDTTVGRAAGAVVAGLAAHRVTATLKHFPGLGRVRLDTDTSSSVVDTTTTAADPQVQVFGQLARSAGNPFVMVSSAVYERLDPTAPAVFSPAVVRGVLRGELGFDGVVVSDDLATAKAVASVPVGQRAVSFLAAGGTLVLVVDASVLPAMEDAVLARESSDPSFAATVQAAVRTALVAKARAGLLTATAR